MKTSRHSVTINNNTKCKSCKSSNVTVMILCKKDNQICLLKHMVLKEQTNVSLNHKRAGMHWIHTMLQYRIKLITL